MTDPCNRKVPPTIYGRSGAYAALQRQERHPPTEPLAPMQARLDWYTGYDEARRRLAELEGELVRGEPVI